MPISAAAVGFSATARIRRPGAVLYRNQPRPVPSSAMASTMASFPASTRIGPSTITAVAQPGRTGK